MRERENEEILEEQTEEPKTLILNRKLQKKREPEEPPEGVF